MNTEHLNEVERYGGVVPQSPHEMLEGERKAKAKEHAHAVKIRESLAAFFEVAAEKPEIWQPALDSLAPHRPTQARRAFRDFMIWDDEARHQAMAALEGAIAWGKDGRVDILKSAVREYQLSPRMAHALFAQLPPAGISEIRNHYNAWRNNVNDLVTKYQRLAFKLANQFQVKMGSSEEWVSHSFLALIKAAEMYDARKAEFMTFAYTWIHGELKKAFEYESERQKLIPSISDTHNESRRPENGDEEFFVGLVPGPNMQFVAVNRQKEVLAAIGALSERERVVIRRLFGLNQEEEAVTADEISQDLGVTRARVYQIKAKALSKMQQHAVA